MTREIKCTISCRLGKGGAAGGRAGSTAILAIPIASTFTMQGRIAPTHGCH